VRLFELTNQDLAGGKNCTFLTSVYVNSKGIEVGQLFSLEMALNIQETGFIDLYNSKTHIRL